jgi:hypothetical protein
MGSEKNNNTPHPTLRIIQPKHTKICYAVIMIARKLRHYFEAHTIRVLTDWLLHDIFRNRDSSRRISKWAMELSEYVVDFDKHNTIKSQILADFVAEWTKLSSETEGAVPESPWLVYCDGAWGQQGWRSHHINLTFGKQVTICSEVAV